MPPPPIALTLEALVLQGHRGAEGEVLSIDAALFQPSRAATGLLVITSGTHGVEGFCGSGGQVGLLRDDLFFQRLEEAGTALLLVHAVNPHGFSHLRRVNEDNIDLNRNTVDFAAAAGVNPAYLDIDPLVLPAMWPPDEAVSMDLFAYVARHGEKAFRDAISVGQYRVPDGMFYGGAAPAWSSLQVRALIDRHAPAHRRLVWLDMHTGLGAWGHGEKLFSGRSEAELMRARQWWGIDVMPIAGGDTVTAPVNGPLMDLAYDLPAKVEVTTLTLEFGTLPAMEVLQALRADHWLHRHPDAPAEQARQIKHDLLAAFLGEGDDWKGMVYGQMRMAAFQAVAGLAAVRP